MPIINYPVVRSYQRIAGNSVARLMLVVRLHHPPFPPFQTLALVDSGADGSVFHTSVATQLGIDLGSAGRVSTLGVGGRTSAFRSEVEMEIEGRQFLAVVRFTDTIPIPIALLGRHDVFRQFEFGFDELSQLLLVRAYP